MAADEKQAGGQEEKVKRLAECPRFSANGVRGFYGLDDGHSSGHRCNRCDDVWT